MSTIDERRKKLQELKERSNSAAFSSANSIATVNGSSSRRNRLNALKVANAESVAANLTSRIETWFKNHNNYISNYNSRYSTRKGTFEDNYVSDSGDWLDTISAQKSNFDKEASAIMSYLDQYGDYFGRDYTDSVKSALQSALEQQSEILKQASSDKDFWSQFADENEYLGYQREAKKQKRYEGYAQKYAGKTYDELLAATNKLMGDEEKEWLNSNKYKLLSTAEDFAEKSKYASTYRGGEKFNAWSGTYTDSGFDDIAYDYINRNETAKKRQRLSDLQSKASFLGLDSSERGEMTDDEIATFNYLYATRGSEEAYAYIDYLTSDLNARQRETEEAKWAKYANESPVGASVLSVVASPLKGLSYIGQTADFAADGEIDQNEGYNKFSYINSALRNEVSQKVEEKWGGVGSFAYQTGMSMGDFLFNTAVTGGNSALSLALMGSGAAADTVIASKDRGLNDNQAFLLGTIAGAAEILTEKFSIDALLDATKLGKSAVGYIVKNTLAEGSEEVGSSFINLIADILVAKDKSAWQAAIDAYKADGMSDRAAFWHAVGDQALSLGLDFLGGAISGGLMGGGGAIVGAVGNTVQGKEYKNTYGADIGSALAGEAVEISPNSKFVQKMQAKTEGGRELSNRQIGKLVQQNEAAMYENDAETIKTAAASRLTELGESGNVDVIASALAKQVTGESLTLSERAALKKSTYGKVVAEEMKPKNIKNGYSGTEWVQKLGTDRINADVYGRMISELEYDSTEPRVKTKIVRPPEEQEEENEATARNSEKIANDTQQVTGKLPASETDLATDTNVGDKMAQEPTVASEGLVDTREEKTATYETAEVKDAQESEIEASEGDHIREVTKKVKEISSVKNGKIFVELENGREVDASEVDFGDDDTALVYRAAAEMSQGAGYNEDTVKVLVNGFESSGLNAAEYLHAFRDSFNYGATGTVSVSALEKGKYTSLLSEKQRELAFHLGKAFGDESAQRAQAERARIEKEKTASAEKTTKAVEASGEVIFDGSVNRGSLSKAQNAQIKVLRGVSSALGAKIHLFASEAIVTEDGRRRRVFSSADGEAITANGWYDNETGEIWIDVNAGVDGNGLILFTAAHELTHFIKDWSSEKYKVFSDFLVSQYAEKGISVDELIEAQIEKAAKRGREMTREEAFDEVVADSCESFLTDSNAAEKIAALNEKDATLAEKIKSYIHKLLVKIRNLLKGIDPDSEEGKIVRGMTNSLEQLYELWTDALEDAGRNYQKGDVSDGKGKIQRSERDSEAYDYTKPFYKQVDDYISGKFPAGDSLVLGATPEVFQKIGFNALPMTINQKHIDYALNGTKNSDHKIGEIILKYLPAALKNPVAIITSKTEESTSVVVILSVTHNGKQINVPVYVDGAAKQNGVYIDSNAVTSVYARSNAITSLLKNALNDESKSNIGLFYWDKKRAIALLSREKVTMPNVVNTLSDGYIHSIREKGSPVKPKMQNVTESQQFKRWFGDWQQHSDKASKIVNEDGTPKIMYHGTKASFTVFDKKKAKSSGLYGKGFYFTDSESHSAAYGDAMAVYLNIRKPISPNSDTVTKSQIRNFLSAVAENEDYSIENYGTYDVDEVLSGITSRDAFAVIQDINATAIGDFVEAVELFNSVNGTQYDGIVVPTETVAFRPEQIKSATDNIGTFDGNNADIRYSERDPDAISNREVLANALEGAVQNDIEAERLAEYKSKIAKFDAEEQKLRKLRAEIKELSFTPGKRDNARLAELRAEAEKTANRINIYDKQLLRLEASKPLEGILQREKQKAYKRAEAEGRAALDEYRARAQKSQEELKTRYQESKRRGVEGRHKTEVRHKIQGIVTELNTLLLNPTAKKHIKEELRRSVAEALSAFNMDTVGAEERLAEINRKLQRETDPYEIEHLLETYRRIQNQGTNLQEKLEKLNTAYEKIKDSDDIELNLAYQEVIQNSIKAVSEKVGDTSIRDMTLEQLEMVYDLFKMIRHTIRDANKAFKTKKGETITQMAEMANHEVRTIGGQPYQRNFVSATLQRIGWTFLKPYVAFRTIGSETLVDRYRELREGEDTFYSDIREAQTFIEEQYEKYGFKSWDMKETKEFKAKSGKSFELTLEQMMTLYAYSKREQAHAHIMEGGIVFEDALVVKKNKLGVPVKYEVTTKDAFNLSQETFADIANALTDKQKAFVDAMQEYLSSTMGAKGNDVSMQLLGVKLFKEKFYLPIKSSQYYMNFKAEEAGEVKLRSPAFSKETVHHANNPIVLHNFTDLWAEHINDMAMYHSFVLALEDFTRVYNYKTKTGADTETMDTKATLETAYPGVTKYINKFLKDMNGGVRGETVGWAEKMTSLAKKGSVLGSASVTIQQPSAIMRAMAYINPKYFMGEKVSEGKHKEKWEELKKYAPIAGIKEMGRFDVGMGQSTDDWIKADKNILEKAEEVISLPPAKMDEVTWLAIWDAVKRETAHNYPKLATGSDAFKTLAGERFTDVISLSQVYDSVFSRSDVMRNKSWIAKSLTAFMAEPTTTLNMLWDSAVQGKRTGSAKGFVATTVSTGSSVLAAIFVNSLLKSFVMAMRDDDEDESYAEKYLEHFVGDFKDNLNPLNLIPFVKDILSIFKGYDVERMDMALFSDLKNAIDAFDSDNKTLYEKWSGLIGAVAAFRGVPFKNIERDVRALFNTFFGKREETTLEGMLYAIEKGWTGEEKSDGQQLYEAMLKGDEKHIERLRARFDSPSDISDAIKKGLRENDLRVKEAAKMLNSGDIRGFADFIDTISGEGFFDGETVEAAIRAEASAFSSKIKEAAEAKRDGKTDDYIDIVKGLRESYRGVYTQDEIVEAVNSYTFEDAVEDDIEEIESIYKYSDINAALESGDTAISSEIIKELIEVKTENNFLKAQREAEENGKRFKEKEARTRAELDARSAIRSSLTRYWKQKYIAADENNDEAEKNRIRTLLHSTGIYAKKLKDLDDILDGWLEE